MKVKFRITNVKDGVDNVLCTLCMEMSSDMDNLQNDRNVV